MSQTKQAQVLTDKQQKAVMLFIESTRSPIRNKVMFLFSVKAGLRAKEIAGLKWFMLLDSEGTLQDHLSLPNAASKGKKGGRVIPLHKDIRSALKELYDGLKPMPNDYVIQTTKGTGLGVQVVTNWFFQTYQELGFNGCSSHSGRRTFITNTARKISTVGGSLRDIQALAGHSSMQATQRYIDENIEAKRKVIDLL
jgi:integrase